MKALAQTCSTSIVYSRNRLNSSRSNKCQTFPRIFQVLQASLGAPHHSIVEMASVFHRTIRWTTWTSRPADSSQTSTEICFWILWTLVWITLVWTGNSINSSNNKWCSRDKCRWWCNSSSSNRWAWTQWWITWGRPIWEWTTWAWEEWTRVWQCKTTRWWGCKITRWTTCRTWV
jgi:hypothetical protein